MEFIDEDVAERADIATVLCIARGTQDHVLEVDPALEARLIFFKDRREDIEERPPPSPKPSLRNGA